MTSVRMSIDAYRRLRGGEPEIILNNRFFEKNPTNLEEQIALILRPALRKRTAVGPGPIRAMHWEPGTFTNDAFVVSANDLYRLHKNYDVLTGAWTNDTVTHIAGTVAGADSDLTPELACRTDVVFVADGETLQQTDGVAALAAIAMPDDVAAVSLDIINSYTIVVVVSSQRCYWINPGELTVDPLNFFEAERSPDWLYQVRTIGDQFWLLGQKTTEVWRMTGDATAPFQRIEGRLFDNGIWAGTAVKIKDDVLVAGNDGMVYRVTDSPQPVSNPGVAEIIRDAIAQEALT